MMIWYNSIEIQGSLRVSEFSGRILEASVATNIIFWIWNDLRLCRHIHHMLCLFQGTQPQPVPWQRNVSFVSPLRRRSWAQSYVQIRTRQTNHSGATQHVTRVSQALESRSPSKMHWFSFPCFGAIEFWNEMKRPEVANLLISADCKCCTYLASKAIWHMQAPVFPPWSQPEAPWVSSWSKRKFIHRIDALLTFACQKHARIAWEIDWNGHMKNQQLTLQGNLVQL